MAISGLLSFILGALALTAIIIAGAVALWLVFGRKSRGEDKVIGGLEQMAHFKSTNSVDGMSRRIR